MNERNAPSLLVASTMQAAAEPLCNDARLDGLARALALDLLVDPRGVRALTAYWVANYTDRPRQPLPGPSFASLVRRLALETRGHADLAVLAYDRGDGKLSFVIRLHEAALDLAFTREFLERAQRWRALLAVAELVQPGVTGPAAFTVGDLGGLRGELRLRGFAHNAMLDHYFRPAYVVSLAAAEFARVLAVKPAISRQIELLMAITLHVADALVKTAVEAQTRGDTETATLCGNLSQLFRTHAVNPHALHVAVEALAAAECAQATLRYTDIVGRWLLE
jgi:hypothetical protein